MSKATLSGLLTATPDGRKTSIALASYAGDICTDGRLLSFHLTGGAGCSRVFKIREDSETDGKRASEVMQDSSGERQLYAATAFIRPITPMAKLLSSLPSDHLAGSELCVEIACPRVKARTDGTSAGCYHIDIVSHRCAERP